MGYSRRAILSGVGAAGLTACSGVGGAPSIAASTSAVEPTDLARDEAYWAEIARQYDVSPDFINLENGYWGVMATPVLEAYVAHTREVNFTNSNFARRDYGARYRTSLERATAALGAQEGELAFTRNATEALKGLVGGYKGLKPGDAVMYADLDYHSIQASMDWVAARDGCSVVKLEIPEPVEHDELVAFYDDAMAAHPDVRLLLVTPISHRTGLVMPVKEIVEAARARNVDVIVDAAHAWGQINIQMDALGADFVGFNLHKWIGAPLGVGAVYIRQSRLGDIAVDMASAEREEDLLAGRIHTGTMNFAAILSVPDALDFHEAIGPAHKEARLRYLRNIWVDAVADLEGFSILAPNDPRLHAAITSFRLDGVVSPEDNIALAEELLDVYGVFTVHRTGVAKGACVRVTPSLYNTPEDCLVLASALRQIVDSRA